MTSEKTTEQLTLSKPIRNHNFKVRLFDDELETAKANAKNAGMPLATYARETLLKERIFNRKIHKDLSQYLGQIVYIGNNINQIAKVLNTHDKMGTLDNAELVNLRLVMLQMQNDLSQIAHQITALSYSHSDN